MFPFQRTFLRNNEAFFSELRPGVRALRDNAPDLADALAFGTPTLRRSVLLSQRLTPFFNTLRSFSNDPVVELGLRKLTGTVNSAEPDAQGGHAAPDHLQLRDAVVPQRLLAALGGRRQRHLAALHHHHDAPGPQRRGRAFLGAGERPD